MQGISCTVSHETEFNESMATSVCPTLGEYTNIWVGKGANATTCNVCRDQRLPCPYYGIIAKTWNSTKWFCYIMWCLRTIQQHAPSTACRLVCINCSKLLVDKPHALTMNAPRPQEFKYRSRLSKFLSSGLTSRTVTTRTAKTAMNQTDILRALAIWVH